MKLAVFLILSVFICCSLGIVAYHKYTLSQLKYLVTSEEVDNAIENCQRHLGYYAGFIILDGACFRREIL